MAALAQKSVTSVGYKLLLVKVQEARMVIGDLLHSIECRKSLHDVGNFLLVGG
jgi:hypothetical protein